MAETFLFYLTLSIAETSAMLRMTNGHPYGERDLLRMIWGYNGKVTGGASPSPTMELICFAIEWDISERQRVVASVIPYDSLLRCVFGTSTSAVPYNPL